MKKLVLYFMVIGAHTLLLGSSNADWNTCVHCAGDPRKPAPDDQAFPAANCFFACDQCKSSYTRRPEFSPPCVKN